MDTKEKLLTDRVADWPALPLEAWKETYATLHMWTQIVGKVRLAQTPLVNHWWNVPLYVTARGLTTSPIDCDTCNLEIRLDFIDHQLQIETGDNRRRTLPLRPQSVAHFYREFMSAMASLGVQTKIWPMPVEISNPIRFDQDTKHAAYDPKYAERFWRILATAQPIFERFRSVFVGKCSPVHFFWGSFDLCVTRFSGRPAPERTGADSVTREAYSHEVISAGFWPGGGKIAGPAFYAYAAPEPKGFPETRVQPAAAFYDTEMKEFFLMYDDVRKAERPAETLMEFLQSTYDAGANLGHWNRKELEREPRSEANVA